VERVYGQYASLAVVTGATAEMMGGEMIAVPLAAMDFM
jgi:mannitol-specific phosphotransferase system IIBC component